jgi:hypothetical protein
VHRRQTRRVQRRQCFIREASAFIDIGRVRRDLALTQIAQNRAQFDVLLGQGEQIELGIARHLFAPL